MQKNGSLAKKIIFTFIIYYLNNTLYAAADGSESRSYNQAKTDQLVELMTTVNSTAYSGPTRRERICLAIKKALRLKLPSAEVQELIKQGADPKKLRTCLHD